jgi:hypothetical protein
MRKIIFFGTGLLLICLASWGVYKIKKHHQNAGSEEAIARLSATDLYNEFVKTENLANQKWVGKVLEISGKITSVSETGNYISINLKASDSGGINCNVLKKDMASNAKLDAGDVITIKGKCTGFLIDVNMVDCVIEK